MAVLMLTFPKADTPAYLLPCKNFANRPRKNKKGSRCHKEVRKALNLFSLQIIPQGRFPWARLAQWKV